MGPIPIPRLARGHPLVRNQVVAPGTSIPLGPTTRTQMFQVTTAMNRRPTTCLWRIDTVGVKRSDLRSARQPRTQAPDDLIGSLSKVDRIPERSRVFGKSRSHWCLIEGSTVRLPSKRA